MLTNEEINDARIMLENSANPLYFFDDDTDGLCSFLVLRKKYGKGIGIPIKTSPELDAAYASKASEIQPDLVVILDKPLVAKEFFESVHVPVVWVDHHPVVDTPKNVHYLNPLVHDKNDSRPTTYQCTLIAGEKSWESLVGCIGDWYLPDFYDDFLKKYSDLLKQANDVGKVIYETRFGELTRVFMFLLKGKAEDIRKNISTLLKIEAPYEILDGTTPQGRYLLKKIEKPTKEYNELLEKASREANDNKILIFVYPGSKNSYTGELANELFYRFPNKMIIVGREKNNEVKMSLRYNKAALPPIIERALIGVKGYGGGHANACGGAVDSKDFERFIQNINDEISSSSGDSA